MKKLLFILLSLSCYLLLPSPTLAGHCPSNPNSTGCYPDNGTWWQDQPNCQHVNTGVPSDQPSPCQGQCAPDTGTRICSDDKTQVLEIQCNGSQLPVDQCNLNEDKRCGDGACQIIYETKLEINPPNPELASEVRVIAKGTRTCSADVKLIPDEGLHNIDNFDDPNCKLLNSNCDGANPADYRCRWEYACIAFRLSDPGQTFTATFPNGSNSACQSSQSYSVGEPQSCSEGPAQQITDTRLGANNGDLIAQSLNDDKIIAQVMSISMLPREINQQTSFKRDTELPDVGVQVGFFIFSALRHLVCNIPISGLFGFNFCPIDVNLATQQTEHFVDLSKSVASAEKPSELIVRPSTKSCYLEDVTAATVGNKRLNDIDTSKRVSYLIDTPDIEAYQPDHDNLNGSIDTVVVKGEYRPPAVNCAQEKFKNLYYPPGYKPPYFQEFGCVTPTPTPTP